MKTRILILAVSIVIFSASSTSSFAQEFTCPTFPPDRAALIVKEVYKKVLERNADDSGLVTFAGKVSGGGWCVQQVVRAIGVSPEYADRFIKNQTPRQAVVLMYRHFLLREPENEAVITHHVNELNGKGWQAKVLDFVNSPEAQKRWGNFNPSPLSLGMESGGAEAQLRAAGCKFFLGRRGNYLCSSQTGYELCERKKKDPANAVTACQLAGVDPDIHKELTARGCSRNSAGEYTCTAQRAFEACEKYQRGGKVKACKRTPIKIGGNG